MKKVKLVIEESENEAENEEMSLDVLLSNLSSKIIYNGIRLYLIDDVDVVDESFDNVDRRGYNLHKARATDLSGNLYVVYWDGKDSDGNPTDDYDEINWDRYTVKPFKYYDPNSFDNLL